MPDILNTNADLEGRTLVTAEGNYTIDGLHTFDRGTSAPFAVVAGAAKVVNLDADKLDGQEGTYYSDPANLSSVVSIAKGGTGAATANANFAFIGPASGGAAAPSFRALVAADVATEQTTTATGAQNDFAPSAGSLVIIRCTGAAPVFSGFTGGAAGRKIILQCLGTTVKVVDESLSTAANQIICESTQGQIVGVDGMILLVYDATSSRWRASVLTLGEAVAWTPTLGGSGGQSGQAYTTQFGRYQQNGKRVWATFNLVMSTLGTVTTDVQIQSLPLTSQNTSGYIATMKVGLWAAMSTALGWLSGVLAANATAITLRQIAGVSSTSSFVMVQADLSNTTQIVGDIEYLIN